MATSSTEFIDSTTADVFIPEIWSPLTTVVRDANMVLAELFDRRFEAGLTFGDTIHVPSLGALAVRSKAKATNAAITYETVTETNTDISIATWEYAAIAVESIVKVQNNRDQLVLYNERIAMALALSIDDVLAGLVDDFSQTVGTLAVENTDDELLRALQYIKDANAPRTGQFIFISPAAEAGFLKLDKFVKDDYSGVHGAGARETGVQQAYTTSFYRVPVYVSTNVEGTNAAGHDNGVAQREAVALVIQMSPTYHAQYDIDYLVDKVAVEQLHGSKEMRDDHGVWLKGA